MNFGRLIFFLNIDDKAWSHKGVEDYWYFHSIILTRRGAQLVAFGPPLNSPAYPMLT